MNPEWRKLQFVGWVTNGTQAKLWLSRVSSFVSVVWVYVRAAKQIGNTLFLYQTVFIHKNDIAKGFLCRNNIFVMERCLETFESLRIKVPFDLFSLFNSNLHQTLLHLGKSIYIFFRTLTPLSGIIIDRIHENIKEIFPIYGFRLTKCRPFVEHIS